MIYLLLATLCFIFFILFHAIAYRIGIIRFETWKLVGLLLVWGVVYVLGSHACLMFFTQQNTLWFYPLRWSSLVAYTLFSLWYLGETTTVQNNSPSMKIIKALIRNPEKRITANDVKGEFTNQEFIIDRLNDLVAHGHAQCVGGKYSLLPRGKLIIRLFKFYRRLLGRSEGG
jgi:hypothetical protein